MKMTVKRRKKSRSMRGVRQHGFGKTHRGAGHRGGRGKAGTGKKADQKKPNVWKTEYFGKSGFVRFRTKKSVRVINLSTLEDKLDVFFDKGFAKKEGDFIAVDLAKAGYSRLLGFGKIKHKFKISVASASKAVVNKLEKAGCTVVLNE